MNDLAQRCRLVLLPGVGAGTGLLAPQQAHFGEAMLTFEYPRPRSVNEPLEDYARRWAEEIRPQVPEDKVLFLGGVSLGGMIALEMAEVFRPAATFLVGSLRDNRNVPVRTQFLEMLGRPVPEAIAKRLRPMLVWPYALREGLDDHNTKLLRELAKGITPEEIKWGGQATVHWGFAGPFTRTQRPVFHIHGRGDWFFPLDDMKADHIIPDGRHLINLTHPLTVNRFIEEHMRQQLAEMEAAEEAGVRPEAVAERL